MCAAVVVVEVVTVAAAEELADIDLLAIVRRLDIDAGSLVPGGMLGIISCFSNVFISIVFKG